MLERRIGKTIIPLIREEIKFKMEDGGLKVLKCLKIDEQASSYAQFSEIGGIRRELVLNPFHSQLILC